MPKYLFIASYTSHGTKGLMKEGGSSRRKAIQDMVEGQGGRMEAFYYALGETDAYVIGDLPDAETAAAISLSINSVGAVRLQTVALMTPEEMDRATNKSVQYRPPGA